ncbi:MAG TPA: trypsin-like peptidase domain-containing protein [Polyangiaceae bacterium LLY-WYZ-15_(1-7)]|nr:trypsin-like peptidase domain-containing protein [Polyangiaceae bacterium LLY-WYZ-15_(1-7)]HJL10854.1 trypsin-like peptidase domain-containing protein [Polyangiaceae bacterium LLY-WYZ-15_(1-7)]HJL35393.1 trypsin-like peptidase domain-containing protein [Polyangiaceae bacterium LLY-WYZ-15_(1-7)]HJL44792.1 trypsin-like peptidase domain-containing protein [Polyangiaceae bacterium LLY-WYZ-15_(1-7)]
MSRPSRVALALALAAALAPLDGAGAQAPELTEDRRIAIAERLRESSVTVRVGSSGGSGFVATSEGWVVTNAHVVRHWRRAPVVIGYGDGRQVRARVLAVDAHHDLAVLAPPEGTEPGVRPLRLAADDGVRVGQTVLAYGSPFGLDGTLTQGIVSARRDLPTLGGLIEDVIQTDAPINPGNSGGPLVSSRGRVIGVNTAILSRTGASNGIGFAVPVHFVRELLAEVQESLSQQQVARSETREAPAPAPAVTGPGRVWIGILGDDYRAPGVVGVRIQRVLPGGPAHEAGLRGRQDPPPSMARRLGMPWTGHIIVGVDGRPVRDLDELKAALERHQPGERARVHLTMADGRVRGEALVELEAPPAGAARAAVHQE